MSPNFSFFIDDDTGELVKRYEQYLSGMASGYFDVEEMERIVDYYLSFGRTRDSLVAVELGKRLHPGSSALDMKRAKIYLATGDHHKALRMLDGFWATDTESEAVFLKIEALVKLERVLEAAELAEGLLKTADEEIDLLAVDVAMIFQSSGHFDIALELLMMGKAFNDTNLDLLFDVAFCQEQLEMREQALNTYKKIIGIDSYVGEAWFNMGQIHFSLEQYEEAIEAFDYVLAINEKDALALLQKGHAHFQQGQWSKALQAYFEYAGMATEKWQVHLFIGECYERMENFTQALYFYTQSYEEMPDNYEALVGISICLLEMDRFQECIEYIEKALAIADEIADAWVYLAEARVGMGEYDEALKAYHRAIAIDPNQPDALFAMGNLYVDKGDFYEAMKYYERAYGLDATLEFIELFIAVATYYSGDYEKTIAYLDLALSRNLDAAKLFQDFCPDADQRLGQLLLKVNEK